MHYQRSQLGAGVNKAAFRHMGEQVEQWVPEPVDIRQYDQLVMPSELRPCHHLDDFFQCADPARKRDKGIRASEHLGLAFVHIRRDDHLAEFAIAIAAFLRDQELRYDSCNLAAAGRNASRQLPHDPAPATAINEADPRFGKRFAKHARRFAERRMIACL